MIPCLLPDSTSTVTLFRSKHDRLFHLHYESEH